MNKNAQANTAAAHSAVKGGLIGGAVVIGIQGAAGCALGTGAGTFLGGLASAFLGGVGAFGGAPIGCAVGAAGAVVEGLPVTIVSTLATGGIIFVLDKNANGNT